MNLRVNRGSTPKLEIVHRKRITVLKFFVHRAKFQDDPYGSRWQAFQSGSVEGETQHRRSDTDKHRICVRFLLILLTNFFIFETMIKTFFFGSN